MSSLRVSKLRSGSSNDCLCSSTAKLTARAVGGVRAIRIGLVIPEMLPGHLVLTRGGYLLFKFELRIKAWCHKHQAFVVLSF